MPTNNENTILDKAKNKFIQSLPAPFLLISLDLTQLQQNKQLLILFKI